MLVEKTVQACIVDRVVTPVITAGNRKTATQTAIWVVFIMKFLLLFVCILCKDNKNYIPIIPLMLSAVVLVFSWVSFSMVRRAFLAL